MLAFPLQWPQGVPRTKGPRGRSKFKATPDKARKDLFEELRLLGARSVVLSTNVRVRLDGMPYATGMVEGDGSPGAAVYFTHPKRGQMCMACDRWAYLSENVRALGQTVAALRGIARWGTAEMVDAAFTGFKALPAPSETSEGRASWWVVLNVAEDAPLNVVEASARALSAQHHPDRGGDTEAFRRVREALEEAQRARATVTL